MFIMAQQVGIFDVGFMNSNFSYPDPVLLPGADPQRSPAA